MFAAGSAVDPFFFAELPPGSSSGTIGMSSYVNLDGRTQVDPRLVPGQSTAVFLTAGQSNGQNCVCSGPGTGVFYTPTNSLVQNLNIYNGGLYTAKDPLLGHDNSLGGGTWQCKLGDLLINAGKYQRVIFVPISIGGTVVSQWAAGGALNARLAAAVRRIEAIGLPLTALLWCQGETDAVNGTGQSAYAASLSSVISTVTGLISTKILVALETWDAGALPAGSTAVRAAQAQVVDNITTFQGPDGDTLDNTNRFDTTHWNATGRDNFATGWKTAIINHL